MADTIFTYNGRIPTLGGGGRIPYFDKIDVDPDAQAFIDATGITDETQKTAVNDLVVGLKDDSLWTKMVAVYPFVGGTADTHKYNLKDPRDLDAAYRITWNGTVTHNSNGITGDASTAYGDTHLLDSTLGNSDKHFSVYIKTNSQNTMCDLGVGNTGGGTADTNFFSDFTTGVSVNVGTYTRINTTGARDTINTLGVPSSRAYWISTRNSTMDNKLLYKNSSLVVNLSGETIGTAAALSHYIMASNNSGASNFSNRNYAFLTFGNYLNSTDASNLNTRVQSFQTSLSRNN
jgi:hypothetical protein